MRFKYFIHNNKEKYSQKKLKELFELKFYNKSPLDENKTMIEFKHELIKAIECKYLYKIYVRKIENDFEYIDREIIHLKTEINNINNRKSTISCQWLVNSLSCMIPIILFMFTTILQLNKEYIKMPVDNFMSKSPSIEYIEKANKILRSVNEGIINSCILSTLVLCIYFLIIGFLCNIIESHYTKKNSIHILFNEICLEVLLKIKNE